MDNNLKLSYLAGLFDGEGTVTLTRWVKNNYRSPCLSLSSTTKELTDAIQKELGGKVRPCKPDKPHHLPSWYWMISSVSTVLIACEKLLPYIKEPYKKKRMQLILSSYKKVTKRNGKYTKNEKLLKERFEKSFFEIGLKKSKVKNI